MFGAMNLIMAASVMNMNTALLASSAARIGSAGVGYRGSRSIEQGGPAGVWLGDPPKPARPYNFSEFQRLEKAVRQIEQASNSGSYYPAQRDAKIENRIRTLMAAGVSADEVEQEASARLEQRMQAEYQMHERYKMERLREEMAREAHKQRSEEKAKARPVQPPRKPNFIERLLGWPPY